MRVSLATKCQLLFGGAALLIITAALVVPWQRMEQLTAQPDESAARLMINLHLQQHAAEATAGVVSARPPGETELTGEVVRPPRLVSLARLEDPSVQRWEQQALRGFLREPDRKFKGGLTRNGERYRYVIPLFARDNCLSCHQPNVNTAAFDLAWLTGVTVPAATTRPYIDAREFIGIASVDIPAQVSSRQLLLNRVVFLTAGLLAGLFAIVTLYLIITRLILQPVRVLQETAEKVSAGDLNIRADINSGDEFQQLSETFNAMLANLKSGSDKLREMNKSLDIKMGELAQSNVALYESNRLKSEFLASVSHELRTPLNSILGFADLLRDTAAGKDAKQGRYVQNILGAGNNLLDLINDLLDLAKIEAGKMEIRVQPLSLGDLFEGLITLLRPLYEAKRLRIAPSVTTDVPIIETDPARLQQVLYNFLSNAIKFSPDGGVIRLEADRPAFEHVRIRVIDNGPGVPADKHAVIFEKFRQVDQSHTRAHGGTGLGLSIAKELTQLLGGTIGIDTTEGGGAVFYCVLPEKILSGSRDLRGRISLI